MLDGFGSLLAEVAAWLLLSATLGLLAGRYLWPRRRRPDVPAVVEAAAPTVEAAAPAGPEVADLERRLRSSRAEVVKLQAEALRLRAAVAAVTDHKDAEMGRLETAAIEALDSMIASHNTRLSAVEEAARSAASAARDHERDLEEERRRALRLQAALAERDERVAQLLADLEARDRRIAQLADRSETESSRP